MFPKEFNIAQLLKTLPRLFGDVALNDGLYGACGVFAPVRFVPPPEGSWRASPERGTAAVLAAGRRAGRGQD